MKFPTIGEITTTSVIQVPVSASVESALGRMLESNHRSIIVSDKTCYRVFSATDILGIIEKGLPLSIPLSELILPQVPTINKNMNILDTLDYLNNTVEQCCVVDDDQTFLGIITHTDIISNIDPDTLMENYRLRDFLKLGKRMKWTTKDVIIADLISDMTKDSFDNLIIVEELRPIGIFTTKDIMKLIQSGEDTHVPICCHMSTPVDVIHQDTSIKEALEFIREKHYKRIITVDDENRLVGTISQKELITLAYSSWSKLIKNYQNELNELNYLLQNKNEEYASLAFTDPLTGLYNRHKFTELFHSSFRLMQQRQNSLSAIFIDIDHFKDINDSFGHNVGDSILSKIAAFLLENLRETDIICRWGGEEFLVLLPASNINTARTIAEKLRIKLEQSMLEGVKPLTASFGISEVTNSDTLEDVVYRADRALYLAKNNGRNCVRTELDLL